MFLQEGTDIFLVFLNISDDSPSKIPRYVFGFVSFEKIHLFPLVFLLLHPIFNLHCLVFGFLHSLSPFPIGEDFIAEWAQSQEIE